MVPETGLELVLPCGKRILSPLYYATELSGPESRDFRLSQCFVQRHIWGAIVDGYA